jgi:hypothetical protein
VHDPFPTPFTDEVLEQVAGRESYSFTDGFSGYHQVRIVEEVFNNILERGLTKVYCKNKEYWDDIVPTVLWAYRKITKKLHKYTPFQLVYGKEVVVPA